MQIDIQRNNGTSITRQIAMAVIDQILSGFLKEGERLPSVRALSKQLNISTLTVVKAYRDLEQQNFLYSVQGNGTFVRKKSHDAKKTDIEESFTSDWQLSVPDYLPRAQFAQFHNAPQKIHLASSMIDPELFSKLHVQTSFENSMHEDGTFLWRYGHVQGEPQLRFAMQKYLVTLNIQMPIENLLVTNGSQQGIDLIARTFLGPGDVVIVEAPTYPGAIDIFRNRGVTILTVPVDQEGMRLDILQQLFDQHRPKLIYTIPNFHNPTGVLMSRKRRRRLLEMAQHTQTLIIEDDPWGEIYYDQKPPAPIKSMDEYGHVIYLKGLSKILAPGCRIGVLSASGSIFKRLLAAKANADLGTPLATQKLLLPLLNHSVVEDHMQNLRTALKIRRDLALKILSEHCPKEVSWIIPQGGFNLWLSLPEWMRSHLVLAEANKKGISFLPGSSCFSVEHENHHMRLSFSFVSPQLLSEGITTLCEILTEIILSTKNPDSSPHF